MNAAKKSDILSAGEFLDAGPDPIPEGALKSSLKRLKKSHIPLQLRAALARHRYLKLMITPVSLFLLIGLAYGIEDWLLRIGFLNAKDIDLGESGTFDECLTNIWYWEGALFILTILAVLVSMLVVIILLHRKITAQEGR